MRKYVSIFHRAVDDSYVVEDSNGFLRHVPNSGGWKDEWMDIHEYAQSHPDEIIEEQPPAEPTLEDKKLIKLSMINRAYNNATSSLVSTYPSTELLTFDKQEQEARSYLADPSVSTPFLSGLAKARGITLDDLVGRVIRKSESFASAVATLTGQRQRYEDLLDAATTVEEVEAIVPKYVMPQELSL